VPVESSSFPFRSRPSSEDRDGERQTMRIVPLPVAGAFVLEIEPAHDERGFFARIFSTDEFAHHGLVTSFVQSGIAFNPRRGTLRGMHFQLAPHGEVKLIRCTAGAVYDVIVDLRSDSPTLRQWTSVELSADNHRSLYVPEGFAHGYITLTDNAELVYQMSAPYHAHSARGIRWNDSAFGIEWPLEPLVISPRDAAYPDFVTDE
jgi:dTDP-4-dehydrorhamnose 3,5-epimerase